LSLVLILTVKPLVVGKYSCVASGAIPRTVRDATLFGRVTVGALLNLKIPDPNDMQTFADEI
jgi:hypothetical protein